MCAQCSIECDGLEGGCLVHGCKSCHGCGRDLSQVQGRRALLEAWKTVLQDLRPAPEFFTSIDGPEVRMEQQVRAWGERRIAKLELDLRLELSLEVAGCS